MSEDTLRAMAQSVMDGEKEDAVRLARQALAEKIPPLTAIHQGFVKGIEEVGRRFGGGDCYLPDLVMAAEAMKAALAVLEPEITAADRGRAALGKAVAGTVEGDIHDIGKTIVCSMLTASGFEVVDLGVNVPPERYVEAVKTHQPDLLLLSALITTTMPSQEKTIQAMQQAGLRRTVKVMVGGAPVTRAWADQIGADGFGANAIEAVREARLLLDAPV